jgi:recombination protein RecR
MAFYLLEHNRSGALALAEAVRDAIEHIGHCQRCRMLSETELCQYCRSERRDQGLICVVGTPADVMAIENAGFYQGRYFVLMGHLSPLDGIGPDELGLPLLAEQLSADVREVIIATNPTVEGEATAHCIAELTQARGITATRIARGIPVGGELEYVDGGTLARAFSGRRMLQE